MPDMIRSVCNGGDFTINIKPVGILRGIALILDIQKVKDKLNIYSHTIFWMNI